MELNQDHDATKVDVQLAVIARDIVYIKDQLSDVQTTLHSNYVLKSDFEPVQKIVYGLVGLVMIAIIGALMALVIKQ